MSPRTVKGVVDLGTFNDEGPAVYPKCSECGAPWVFRWCFTLSGSKWLWTRDCKHKKAEPTLVGRDGKEVES